MCTLFISSLCSFSVRNGLVSCKTRLQKSWLIHPILLNEWLDAAYGILYVRITQQYLHIRHSGSGVLL
jgi:hypothetical protein